MIIRIMVGLPASGKTWLCKEYMRKKRCNTYYFSETETQMSFFEQHTTDVRKPMLSDDAIKTLGKRASLLPGHMTVLFDGLFLTTERIEALIQALQPEQIDEIILDYWPENKEECLRNDYMRRRVGSSLSIENLHIDVDFDYLKKNYPVHVRTHEVHHTPDYALFFRPFYPSDQPEDEKYFRSPPWKTGGRSWDCYGDTVAFVDAEEVPSSFAGLDEMLENACPQMTANQYRKVYDACVSVKEKEVHDYYSNVFLNYYECDMEKLYGLLIELGLTQQGNSVVETPLTETEMVLMDGMPVWCEQYALWCIPHFNEAGKAFVVGIGSGSCPFCADVEQLGLTLYRNKPPLMEGEKKCLLHGSH